MVAAARDDILVIDGGMVDVPGPVNFHFNFGFPPGKAYACMAETIALALEGRFEDYTLGKDLTRDRVEEIGVIAKRHGFRLSGFRSFEQEVTEQHIETVRRNAKNVRVTCEHMYWRCRRESPPVSCRNDIDIGNMLNIYFRANSSMSMFPRRGSDVGEDQISPAAPDRARHYAA
jgi:hypothetical protein